MSATIASAKLDLRLLTPGDAALYTALYGDPETMAFVGAAQDAARLARSFASTCRANTASPPRRRTWVIHERGAGRDLGLIGLVWDAAATDGRQGAELGVVLPPALQGRGIASEAVAALVGPAFSRLGLDFLHTRHRDGHGLAAGLMQRVGFCAQPIRAGEDGQRWQLAKCRIERNLPRLRNGPAAGETANTMSRPGSLACVGLGMTLGAHLTPRSRSHIEQADVVFVAVSDPLVELWVQQMHPDVRSLQPYYAEGKPRHDTYREMVAAMLAEVRLGKRVCGAFYGHPGVFAQAPHRAVRQARAEGFPAVMEPGISAEDCLYADLGIDPGRIGCQHYEASQLMFYRRRLDSSAYLVLWQVGIAGDRSFGRFTTNPQRLRLLVDLLAQDWPRDHPCTLYEAATLPIQAPRIETVLLQDLPDARLHLQSTLVLPPATRPERNLDMLARLDALDSRADGEPTIT